MSPRLFVTVASLQARKLMSYRVDFWVGALATFGTEMAIAYFLWQAIFSTTDATQIGGFGFRGMIAYYLIVILVSKLVFGRLRDLTISQEIYEGTLNKYLMYPSPYGTFKYAEHLGNALPAIIQAAVLGFLAWWVLPLPEELGITVASALRAVASLLMANLLLFLLRFPVQALAFWVDNVWSLNVMLRFVLEFFGGLLLPLSLFPGPLRELLDWTPMPYLFYQPTMVLLGEVDTLAWARGLAIAGLWVLITALVSREIWRRGRRVYAGVGI
ncbi:MAG: ABC-2 family transporter protein [Acidobacteriota bacterium]